MEKILISNGKPLIQDGAVLVYDRDNEAFQIPTVSNIKLSDKGILTFDVVDASNFEQFVPSVKYLIDVNGYTITTETNEYFARPYLLDGENKISVSTIMTLTHSDGRKSYHFSKPVAELFTLDVQLNYGLSNFGIISLNNKAYIFGGTYTASAIGSASTTNSIMEFDADTKTIKYLSGVSLPDPIYGISAIAFNDKIYLFGGYDKSTNDRLNTIMEFDPIAKGLTTLDATIHATANAHCFVINDKIYMFEFSYGTGDWLEFDPNTKTRIYLTDRRYTHEGIALDGIIYSAMFNNNKIYLFPVRYSNSTPNFVLEYDFENNIYARIDLQFDFRNSTMINVIGCAYILKGNEIYMFDGKQIKLIDGSLLQTINSKLGSTIIGDKAYIFGGGAENKSIYELTY